VKGHVQMIINHIVEYARVARNCQPIG
jgi:hypothetical protein